ncbi:NEDD4-binding protein 2-like 2 [Rhynchocyon petersi]
MPFGEAKPLARGEEPPSEPCYKRLKAAEEKARDPAGREKTGPHWMSVPVVNVKGHCPQEDRNKTREMLNASDDARPQNRPATKGSSPPLLVSTQDGIYSTSTAFIGPLYKPPKKKKEQEKRSQANSLSSTGGKRGQKEKRKPNSKKSEIDSELSQFYREIEELEKDTDDLEGSWQDPEPCQELSAYQQDQQSAQRPAEQQPDPLVGDAAPAICGHPQFLEEPGRFPCVAGPEAPPYPEASFSPFRPAWPCMPPTFIVPQGPPPPFPPSCSYPVHFQRFHVLPNPPPPFLQTPDHAQMWNGCYVNAYPVNWSHPAPAPGQSSGGPPRDDRPMAWAPWGGFETREGHWEAVPTVGRQETGVFMKPAFPEENLEKLQKLLILLRGLPGSGKTTLSRILLGQSRDGIVFSTDDYFRCQDGYRYDVNQLSDAHDWNQNRAKQAIDQGRSPVIIDNTNTQAWEMKPYVEMAIGKGYRVEFHEPETWWKFDPEELEKRNKHGVSRKKIAQMLDRYEFQMSISIVMNSVEPSHKNAQRLPLPEWRPRERDLMQIGHGLRNVKQKGKGARSKTQTWCSNGTEKTACGPSSYLPPGSQEPVRGKEEHVGTRGKPRCAFTGGLGRNLEGSSNGSEDRFPGPSVLESYCPSKGYHPAEEDEAKEAQVPGTGPSPWQEFPGEMDPHIRRTLKPKKQSSSISRGEATHRTELSANH